MANGWTRMGLLLFIVVGGSTTATGISEETEPDTCGNRLIKRVICEGRYCDNIALICGSETRSIYDVRWTDFVSEEGEGVASCHVPTPFSDGEWSEGEPAFITGFSCRDKYCDKVALECVALIDVVPASFGGNQCSWTEWFSEEEWTLDFPGGFAATKMECSGRYCDRKRFFVCPIVPRPLKSDSEEDVFSYQNSDRMGSHR